MPLTAHLPPVSLTCRSKSQFTSAALRSICAPDTNSSSDTDCALCLYWNKALLCSACVANNLGEIIWTQKAHVTGSAGFLLYKHSILLSHFSLLLLLSAWAAADISQELRLESRFESATRSPTASSAISTSSVSIDQHEKWPRLIRSSQTYHASVSVPHITKPSQIVAFMFPAQIRLLENRNESDEPCIQFKCAWTGFKLRSGNLHFIRLSSKKIELCLLTF